MKKKTKIIALLEIAIVLCSVFLVAMPAIAADQNQEMQKVSANTITTASEDDYVLGIYGNANEDDTIDMRDLTYVKLIFFGKKPETELADAKYDGKINPLDFIQIKLIIVGKEKEITLIQRLTYKEYERAKTFNLPIKRIIALDDAEGEPLRVLGAEDLVVGVGSSLVTHDIILPEMSKLPNIGSLWGGSINYEKLLSLKPDLFMGSAAWPLEETEEKLESYGIQVFLDSCTTRAKDIIKVGYLVGKKDKAEEFYDFREGFLNEIKARTEGLSEDEKPRVYIEAMGRSYYTSCPAAWNKHDQMCTIAGGINIAHDLVGEKTFVNVDPEWVIAQNPDIIVKEASGGGYGIDDTTEMKAIRDEIMNRPELANINAVKGGNVYVVAGDLARSGQQGFMMAVYMAKWFHPDLFEDLDPKATHQEYIDRFLRIDYNLNEHGVFVYPEPS